MKPDRSRLSFIVIALGVAFEHFDMMLVSLLSSSIVEEFVGVQTPSLSLFFAYMGYSIAFLFRPLGAFFFGCIGDLYGRKTSLISSMVLMSAATLALAFIPSARSIGIASTILFVVCRISQGLAVGGEYGTAMTYSYELNSKFRTLYGACVVSSTHLGGMFASLLASRYSDNLRTTFLIGGAAGFLLLLFRSSMKEYHQKTSRNAAEIATESIQDKGAILKALMTASTLVIVFYGSLIYLNELVHLNFGVARAEIFEANTLLLLLWIIVPPCTGYAIDRLGCPYKRTMRIGAIGIFLSAPILGLAVTTKSYTAVFSAQVILHLSLMLFSLCTPRFFGDLFAGAARNTSIATTYSLGASFTSALAPAICHGSIALFKTDFAICLPFMAASLATVYLFNKEKTCDTMILSNSTTLKSR